MVHPAPLHKLARKRPRLQRCRPTTERHQVHQHPKNPRPPGAALRPAAADKTHIRASPAIGASMSAHRILRRAAQSISIVPSKNQTKDCIAARYHEQAATSELLTVNPHRLQTFFVDVIFRLRRIRPGH